MHWEELVGRVSAEEAGAVRRHGDWFVKVPDLEFDLDGLEG